MSGGQGADGGRARKPVIPKSGDLVPCAAAKPQLQSTARRVFDPHPEGDAISLSATIFIPETHLR
jgi:hypothetical protein